MCTIIFKKKIKIMVTFSIIIIIIIIPNLRIYLPYGEDSGKPEIGIYFHLHHPSSLYCMLLLSSKYKLTPSKKRKSTFVTIWYGSAF
ncbi:hypothetical protein L873DRAFT_427446 [Choiromyces venosus 120613-1]|uniref:Uncharacterized protein n=1 Tax=Choiromyces venosus 120613-1 TaxID=1336337 RepID=A0A3N4JZJ4_9PEZI|nr:hypothetical protein L873DRAFT_427446 [Choiromyces venosus 120613-1]